MADYLMVRLRTTNYEQWYKLFTGCAVERKALGCKGGMIFRDTVEIDKVTVLLMWEHAGARQFINSFDIKNALEQIGVLRHDQAFEYLDMVEMVAS